MKKNPFLNVGCPVFSDAEYIERQELFDRLVQHVDNRTILGALYGLPRVGKTSLALRLGQYYKKISPNVHFVYEDLSRTSRVNHFAQFWRDARIKLGRQIDFHVNAEDPLAQNNYERDLFLDLVEEVQNRNEWVLFVIDEFCTCLKYNSDDANDFIDDFRSMIAGEGIVTRGLQDAFCCLTISRRRPEYIQSKTGGSTLANAIPERFEVGLFSEEEFRRQCSMIPAITPNDVSQLEKLTGRHPYLTALIGKVLYSERCSVDEARGKVESVFAGYFGDVKKLIDEATEQGLYIPDEFRRVVGRGKGSSDLPVLTVDLERMTLQNNKNSKQVDLGSNPIQFAITILSLIKCRDWEPSVFLQKLTAIADKAEVLKATLEWTGKLKGALDNCGQLSDPIRKLREKIEKPEFLGLNSDVNEKCLIIPKGQNRKEGGTDGESANWDKYFAVRWMYKGDKYSDIPLNVCPELFE